MEPSLASAIPSPTPSVLVEKEADQDGSPGRSLSIRLLEDSQTAAWDAFARAHPMGTPFHTSAWKRSIEEVFPYRPMYLMAFDGEQVRGCLPLFLVENFLVGRVLMSTPFAVYGGVLADSPEVYRGFKDEVRKLGESLRVDHIELRNSHEEQCLGFARISRYVTFTQAISPNEEKTLESIPRKTRYMVRKSLKHGFETRICSGRSKAFETLYEKNLRRLGTPSFPAAFFMSLQRHFGKDIDIREVALNGEVASAVLSLYFRDQVLPYYGASAPELNALAPNNFMYFDLMRSAGKAGYRTFDFGRSKKNTTGSYEFKAHWGMVERDLPYEMLLIRRKALPNFTPMNPVFQLPQKIWQRLPLFVTKRLGPAFVKLVP